MNYLTDSELFERYLSIYWVCDKVKKDLTKNAWTHPHIVPECNQFEMDVAYEHMEQLIPKSHIHAINILVYGC